jgi:uncharacterized protein YbjT (DUF2867 family)
MDIAVIGATGTLGRLLVARLDQAGHHVRPLSRGAGVDALSGQGLEEALAGADVVVDTLNVTTLRADRAISTFTRTSQRISRAAEQAGVRRIVLVSIAGAADPAVHRRYGYYRGKAAQERVYALMRTPVTIVHSTQWFELASLLLATASLGPVAVLPRMRMAPVAADSVAALVVREIEADAAQARDADRSVAIRGPEEMTGAELVRRILDRRGRLAGRSPRLVLDLPVLGRGMAGGGLIPAEAETDAVTLEDWLDRTA